MHGSDFKCFSADADAREYCLRTISLFKCGKERSDWSQDDLLRAIFADTAEYDRTHPRPSAYPVKGSNYCAVAGSRNEYFERMRNAEKARTGALSIAGYFLADVLERLDGEERTRAVARFAELCGVSVAEFCGLAGIKP